MKDKNTSDKWLEKHIEKVEKIRKTKPYKKMWNYVREILDLELYNKNVKKIRKEISIPVKGFKWEDFSKIDYRYRDVLSSFINQVCKRHKINHIEWSEVFYLHILYDKIIEPTDIDEFYTLCWTEDVSIFKLDPSLHQKEDDEYYPIAIRVSAYASKRDILEYIKKNYKDEILFIQEKYRDPKIKIGKIREKNERIRKRNDFIYKNREKPLQEISKLVREKFRDTLKMNQRVLDDGHIGKIISLEKKRRKEV